LLAFDVDSVEVVLHPLGMVSVPVDQLGPHIGSLAAQGQSISDALDELLTKVLGLVQRSRGTGVQADGRCTGDVERLFATRLGDAHKLAGKRLQRCTNPLPFVP